MAKSKAQTHQTKTTHIQDLVHAFSYVENGVKYLYFKIWIIEINVVFL